MVRLSAKHQSWEISKMSDQKKATEQKKTRDQLSEKDLEKVAGGLNPQPLPPGIIREPNFRT
jgi:hypothetical protein